MDQIKRLNQGINLAFIFSMAIILIAPVFKEEIHLQSIGAVFIFRLLLVAVMTGHRESLEVLKILEQGKKRPKTVQKKRKKR